jgi:hypothetical protein
MSDFNSSFSIAAIPICIMLMTCLSASIATAQQKEQLTIIENAKQFYETDGLIIIDFDVDTEGEPTKPKQAVGDLYASQGVAFAVEDSEIGVILHRYNCSGPSGKLCAGGQAYLGIIRISFHDPDDPDEKATITQFGVQLAAVKPGGTKIEAYDSADQLIGSIEPTKQWNCFLGAKSKTPIHFLRIVPNPEIDPDYAFDDLGFDKPERIMD